MAYVSKDNLVDIFFDTEKFYTTDEFLREAVRTSITGTKFYGAQDYPSLPAKKFKKTAVTVVRKRSFEAAVSAQRKHLEARIAVHNFASATNPGGGVKHGSRAQEEALCRCSTLYPALNTDENFRRYYKVNRERADSLYDDACIYTPEIIICKSDVDKPARLPRDKWDTVDVITIAAPNLRERPNNAYNPGHANPAQISDEELFALQEKRLRHMFTVVAHNGAEIFVTGAFGCGAFSNNPEVVARAYKKILPEFDGYFKEIVFAIYCRPQELTNFEVFKKILTGEPT
ncbi:MAG: TIGR02452 family protein [Selenomonadaceae bacterium]|nr:TIGR02452 family protein [Selenomonadaceae bacterium]